MAKIYYDKEADLKLLKGKTVGIIGYGSQGHAHALNLRDSGVQVIVANTKGSAGWKAAKEAGFDVMTSTELAKKADIIVMLVPDAIQKAVYTESVEKNLIKGKVLMFAHGFNIHYGQIVPPKDIALAYAKGLGCTRAGVLETTFGEETETDLFGEQAVLCGGVSELIKAGFETLVVAGYQPEIAYFECLHELKLIVDLVYQGGLTWMRHSISDTAEYGDYTRGPRIINDDVRAEMDEILTEIQDGRFAREWILENQAGRPVFNAARRTEQDQLIEEVGKELRSMMSWLKEPKK